MKMMTLITRLPIERHIVRPDPSAGRVSKAYGEQPQPSSCSTNSFLAQRGKKQGKKPLPLTRTARANIRVMFGGGTTKTVIANKLGITQPRVTKTLENDYRIPDHVESDDEWVSDEVRHKYLRKASTYQNSVAPHHYN